MNLDINLNYIIIKILSRVWQNLQYLTKKRVLNFFGKINSLKIPRKICSDPSKSYAKLLGDKFGK